MEKEFEQPDDGIHFFDLSQEKPMILSHAKLQKLRACRRCFRNEYLQVATHQRVQPEQGFGGGTAAASDIDRYYKEDFDEHRKEGTTPEYLTALTEEELSMYPTEDIDEWRDTRRGMRVLYERNGVRFLLQAALDDVLQNAKQEMNIFDVKSTSNIERNIMDDTNEYHGAYRNQVRFYQNVARLAGYDVAQRTYFLFTRFAPKGKGDFDTPFNMRLAQYDVPDWLSDEWIDELLADAHHTLTAPFTPLPNPWNCKSCRKYVQTLLADAVVGNAAGVLQVAQQFAANPKRRTKVDLNVIDQSVVHKKRKKKTKPPTNKLPGISDAPLRIPTKNEEEALRRVGLWND